MDISTLDNDQFGRLKFKIRDEVIFRDLDGEMIIMDTDSGSYSGLNETGARIWTLISESRSMARVMSLLQDEYEVSSDSFVEDVRAFIQNLLDENLVEVEDARPAA